MLLNQNTRFIFKQNVTISGFMSGIGLAYAFEEKKYWHMPIIVITPGLYAGFQVYLHREQINKW
jgi:hypothetical protein